MEGLKFQLNAQIDNEGTLRVNMVELREIVKRYPNQKAILTLEILNGGDVEIMKAWYRNYVLPKVVTAWRELGENFTSDQADQQLSVCTSVRCEHQNKQEIPATVDDLDRETLKRYLDEVKVFCSINLNCIL